MVLTGGIQVDKYESGIFGSCPRVYCVGCNVVPCGRSDLPGMDTVKLFCPNCNDIYVPPSSRFQGVDGESCFSSGGPSVANGWGARCILWHDFCPPLFPELPRFSPRAILEGTGRRLALATQLSHLYDPWLALCEPQPIRGSKTRGGVRLRAADIRVQGQRARQVRSANAVVTAAARDAGTIRSRGLAGAMDRRR
jgi:hypothetical protein